MARVLKGFDIAPPEVPAVLSGKFSHVTGSTSHIPHSLHGWLDELIREQAMDLRPH